MSRPTARTASVGAALTALVLAGAMLIIYGLHLGWDSKSAVGADAASSSSPSASPSPSPSPSRIDPAIAVRASVAAYLASSGTHASLALLDQTTGEKIYYQESVQFETASIVKVDILSTLLYQRQQHGETLTTAQQQTATKMITQSDNNAATSLWNQIGATSGLAAANRVFGLTQTTPGTNGQWGLTKTTAADQLRLLQMLTNASGPLNQTSRTYILSLMNKVENDQRWGVPDAADKQTTNVYVKNGWLSRSADAGKWIINSIGRIIEPGHDWLVVVLSNYHPTMSSGVSQVEHAADLAVNGLRSPAA
jgi:beta-lactamase class A